MADVAALREIGREEALDNRCLELLLRRPSGDGVRRDSVRDALGAIEREADADLRAEVFEPCMGRIERSRVRSKALLEVLRSGHAFGGRVRVEHVWAKVDLEGGARMLGDRPLELVLSKKAPGTNHVRKNVDSKRVH